MARDWHYQSLHTHGLAFDYVDAEGVLHHVPIEDILAKHNMRKVHLEAVAAGSDRKGSIVRKILARCLWVDRGYKDGPCLEWQGPDSGKPGRGRDKGRGHSYARMCLDGVTCAVHRVLWITLNGFLPSKKQLDHLCKNRRCVLHCEPVTHKENQRRRDNARLLQGHVPVPADGQPAPRCDAAP